MSLEAASARVEQRLAVKMRELTDKLDIDKPKSTVTRANSAQSIASLFGRALFQLLKNLQHGREQVRIRFSLGLLNG